MPPRIRHHHLLCSLLVATALAATSVYAGKLPPRPQLDHYDSEEAFVKDVLAWERRKRELAAAGESRNKAAETKATPHDWHHVTGPENLDEAVRNAYGYQQPDYKEKYRFNRTTHLSFPLERLAPGQLSRSVITGGLQDMPGEGRSLQPLPELRTIIEETNEMLELGELSPRQAPETEFNESPRVTQRVEVAPR